MQTSGIGVCSCMLKSTTLQSCSANYHAQRISPNPTQLCLISVGISLGSSGAYSANYADLASIACANLNGAQTWCMNIWLENSANAYLTVGLAMLQARRRLLSVEQFVVSYDWDTANEPCRSIMKLKQLGTLEQLVADECLRWRDIGERAILTYSLQNVTPIQFTSYTGMATAALPLKVYFHVLQYTDWFQPIMVYSKQLLNILYSFFNATEAYVSKINIINITETVHVVEDLLPFYVITQNESNKHSRRLMSWKDDLEDVKTYSIQIANDKFANLAPSLANVWNEGPFFWPPNYNYIPETRMVWNGTAYNLETVGEKHFCLAASITYNLTMPILKSTISYYQKNGPTRPVIDYSFVGALPKFPQATLDQDENDPLLLKYFKELILSWTGINFKSIKAYLSSPDYGITPSQFSQDLNSIIKCDFDKVQHCSAHRRSLFWGALVVSVAFGIVSYFCKLWSVPMVDPILFMIYIPSVMIYVFNYSPFCIPMFPTCYMDELLSILETMFPVFFSFPNELQHWDNCFEGAQRPDSAVSVRPGTVDCLRQCTDWPFEYDTWEDNVAWLQCDLGFCDSSFVENNYVPWASVLPLPEPFYSMFQMRNYVNAIKRKTSLLQIPDKRLAHRLCCFFTIFNVVPVLLFLVVLAVVLISAVFIAVSILQNAFSLFFTMLAFIYSS